MSPFIVGKVEMRTDLEFHNDLAEYKRWGAWRQDDKYHELGEGVRRYRVKVVEIKDAPEIDSYGYSQAGEASIVFEISWKSEGDEAKIYFKKFGEVSSYSDTTWEGKFVRVYPKAREVTYYEFG